MAARPSVLDLEINAFESFYHAVAYRDGVLLYSDSPYPQLQPIALPDDQQWADFLSALETIDVWNWKHEYYTPTLDGTQ